MKISIVIPTYNRPQMLDRLLNSISKQTYKNYEVIVIDDNSETSDANQNVLSKHRKLLKEIHYEKNQKNLGAPKSRNRGVKTSKSDWIAFVDDDDEWKPSKLEKQALLATQADSKLGIVYTWTQVIKDEKTILEMRSEITGNARSQILKECFIPSPSVLVRKSAIIEAGLFDPKLPSCQDWDMWTRILHHGYECAVVKSFESFYHKHSMPSIGDSEKAPLGYRYFFEKHQALYRKHHTRKYIQERLFQKLSKIKRALSFS